MDVFSNLMVIGECLLDVRRTEAFKRAIKETVQKGDIVLDVGTGSGILSLFSLSNGAKHVHSIEIASDVAAFAQKNFDSNGYTDKVTLHVTDANELTLNESIDVLTMELMDTWLVAEHQAVVLNTLRKRNIISPQTKLIPYRYQCALELIEYDFSFYGFRMPFVIQARNFAVMDRITKKLTEKNIVNDIDFYSSIETEVNKRVSISVKNDGLVNAVALTSRIFLTPHIKVWGTTDMNMPVIIPLPERKVKQNEIIELSIRYSMAEGYENFTIEYV